MTKVTIEPCRCGHPRCNYYGLSDGSFDQGNGWDKDLAQRHADCFNACEGIADPSVVGEAIEALREVTAELAEFASITINGLNDEHLTQMVKRANDVLAKLEGRT